MGLVNKDDDEYDAEEELQSAAFRDKLNAGLCDKLFKDFRTKENTFWIPDRKMYTVILSAMVMQSGAKINDDNIQHLREIVPRIHSSPGYAWPLNDEGFRDPGRAQFLAALDHYKPGTPRTFCELRSAPSRLISMFANLGHTLTTTGKQLLPMRQDRGRPGQAALSVREMQCGFVLRPGRHSPNCCQSHLNGSVSNSRRIGLPEGSLEGPQAFMLRSQEPSHDA